MENRNGSTLAIRGTQQINILGTTEQPQLNGAVEETAHRNAFAFISGNLFLLPSETHAFFDFSHFLFFYFFFLAPLFWSRFPILISYIYDFNCT